MEQDIVEWKMALQTVFSPVQCMHTKFGEFRSTNGEKKYQSFNRPNTLRDVSSFVVRMLLSWCIE